MTEFRKTVANLVTTLKGLDFLHRDDVVTGWSVTVSDDNLASEKLVKDSLDDKASSTDLTTGLQNIGAYTIHTVYNVSGTASAYDISSGLSYAQLTPVFFLVKNNIGDNQANATLKYYPNGDNITILDAFSSNSASSIQQGVWKKDTWGLFFCANNNWVQLKCVFYDSVDIDELFSNLSSIATSGSYNDLSNKPTIPSKTSDLSNDSNFATTTNVSDSITAHNSNTSAHNLNKSQNIAFGTVRGTTSEFTVNLTGVTLTEGTVIALYNAIGNNVANATLNVNSLGAKPLYNQASAIPASRFPNKSVCLFVYNTTILSTGCWQIIYSYGANSTYNKATTTPIADTSAGAVGTINKYALADHSHPQSSLYAEASHTHNQYLTSHQSIKTINNNSLIGTGNVDLSIPTSTSELANDGDSQGFLYLTTNDVINDLISNTDNSPLSAKQGKVLKGLVDGKASSTHNHSISDVTDLQTTLNGKANSSHTHTVSQLSNAITVAVTVTYTDSTTETITFLKQS